MSAPVRIQRKRTKGWKMPENTLYVGRPSLFGNPLPRGGFERANYMCWLAGTSDRALKTMAAVSSLRGKNLACWCSLDQPCHADVLLDVANKPEWSAA
ncbi:DUF4326 domain-containing protein [Bradyrhizobium sp. RT9a]|uniref:DUF4326 domain-containing protein n=1 Tax=Bradyrhizobium sp. RT9a TaxID=3156384 RepID=UPI0033978469